MPLRISSLKIVWTVVWLMIAVASVMYAISYYTEHRTNIWLQLEEVVATITLPLKLAALYNREPLETVPVPVAGVPMRDIADTWGNARSGGRTHEGTDIFAPRNTPVYAAAPGFVLRTGENNLGGTVVFTVGPGGVRYYYAHLERIAEGITFGTPVTTDTVLGFVGNSGNAGPTPPHLHFGVYDDGAQNPYPLLVDRVN